jgi:hypothetical protein
MNVAVVQGIAQHVVLLAGQVKVDLAVWPGESCFSVLTLPAQGAAFNPEIGL